MSSHHPPAHSETTPQTSGKVGKVGVRVVGRPDSLEQRVYLPEVIRGLGVTAKHFFANLFSRKYTVTVEYPEQKLKYADRHRGLHRLMLRDDSIATYRLITAEAGRFPELGRAFYLAGPQKGKEMLAEFFGRAAEKGHLKPGYMLGMAIHFMTLCKGELQHRKLWSIDEPSEKDFETTVANAVNVFLAAYGS